MSREKTIRVIRMKENFMRLHYEGFSIEEIAGRFGITPQTVYNNLQDIATENGIASRNFFLHSRKVSSVENNVNACGKKKYVNAEELLTAYDEAINATQTIWAIINRTLTLEEYTDE